MTIFQRPSNRSSAKCTKHSGSSWSVETRTRGRSRLLAMPSGSPGSAPSSDPAPMPPICGSFATAYARDQMPSEHWSADRRVSMPRLPVRRFSMRGIPIGCCRPGSRPTCSRRRTRDSTRMSSTRVSTTSSEMLPLSGDSQCSSEPTLLVVSVARTPSWRQPPRPSISVRGHGFEVRASLSSLHRKCSQPTIERISTDGENAPGASER